MTSLNISLPESLKEYLENQVKERGYSTPSDYIRALVREDQKRKAEQKLEGLLLDGINSGKPIEVTSQYWEQKRRRLVERQKDHKSRTGTR